MQEKNKIPTEILRSKRKSLSVELKGDKMIVRAPYQMREEEIEKFLNKKQSWIESNWQRLQERKAKMRELPPYSEEELAKIVAQGKEILPKKVQYYAEIIGVDYGRITIRKQRTRWGSCSNNGNLSFNCLLVLMPDEVIDSVVVHELCHRKYMNHSAQFYKEVERVFPEYNRCRSWLKENGSFYLCRIAQKQGD